MPLDLEIIRSSDFVRVGPRKLLDFEASKDALAFIARACRKRGIDRALLDLRTLPIPPKPLFSVRELTELVDTFHEAGFTRRQRLAVLYRADPHRGARTFAFIGSMQGWKVRAFDDFEKALLWLSEGPGEHQSSAEQVPIHVAARKPQMKLAHEPAHTRAHN